MYANQNRVIDFFRKTLRNKRLAHAYLIEGPEGVDKEEITIEVAKLINCQEENIPCNQCVFCKKIATNKHPDVIIISPSGPLRTIKIDQIRSLKKSVHYKPFEAEKKVCVIAEADTMKAEASNALLKILEEPPEHTVLLLTSSRREKLLPTIISRCQSVHVFPLSFKEVERILIEEHHYTLNEAKLLSVLSQGEVKKALERKAKGFLDRRDRLFGVLASGKAGNLLDLFSYVEQIMQELEVSKEETKTRLEKELKEYLKEFDSELTTAQKKLIEEKNRAIVLSGHKQEIDEYLNIMLWWFRDTLLIKKGEMNSNFIINIDKVETIKTFAKERKYEVLLENIATINRIKKAAESSVNLKLAFEVLFLKVGILSEAVGEYIF